METCQDKAMPSAGYIYILLNRAFQSDHYKIGKTTKKPTERAREISAATGVPRSFEVIYEERVADCHRAESLVHQRLHQHRSATNREFFVLPLRDAIRVVAEVANEVGKIQDEVQTTLPVPPESPTISSAAPSAEINLVPIERHLKAKRNPATNTTFEDHVSYTDAPRGALLHELRRRLFAHDPQLRNGETCTAAQRVAYNVPGHRQFLEVKVKTGSFYLRVLDGKVADTAGIAAAIPESKKWPWKWQINIETMADLDAAMPFVEAARRVSLR